MKLIIDIPKEEFENLKKSTRPMYWSEHLIKNGTPLPKGHGDLIDKSNLLTVTDYDGENEKTYVLYEEIENAQPIIEADKESEE